jgi:hypothetical protein
MRGSATTKRATVRRAIDQPGSTAAARAAGKAPAMIPPM